MTPRIRAQQAPVSYLQVTKQPCLTPPCLKQTEQLHSIKRMCQGLETLPWIQYPRKTFVFENVLFAIVFWSGCIWLCLPVYMLSFFLFGVSTCRHSRSCPALSCLRHPQGDRDLLTCHQDPAVPLTDTTAPVVVCRAHHSDTVGKGGGGHRRVRALPQSEPLQRD